MKRTMLPDVRLYDGVRWTDGAGDGRHPILLGVGENLWAAVALTVAIIGRVVIDSRLADAARHRAWWARFRPPEDMLPMERAHPFLLTASPALDKRTGCEMRRVFRRSCYFRTRPCVAAGAFASIW